MELTQAAKGKITQIILDICGMEPMPDSLKIEDGHIVFDTLAGEDLTSSAAFKIALESGQSNPNDDKRESYAKGTQGANYAQGFVVINYPHKPLFGET